MSQENKGEDRLEQVIQGYEERITKLEAKLDAAREAHDKVSIESLQRELVELRNRVYIQRRCERIAKLEAKLDAAREARDEVSIKDLEEELDKLRDHVERLRAMRLGIGVGSSTQSGLLGRTRPREDTTDPFRPTPLWYAPNCDLQPDSNGEIPLNLKAEIEPIPCRANDLVLEAVTDEQKAVVQWSYTAYDPSLSEAVVGFLRSKIHGQSRSESAYHSRNDCFLDIIRIIGATKSRYSILDMTRDQYERGKTEAETGPDATIYEERYPELVVVEEQAMYDLVNAERELCAKFAFLPHYLRLTRIVGIVIAGNQFKIGFIHRDPMRFQVLMNLTTGQAGNGYTLVRAAVNIGIWFRATMNRGLLERISFSFGVGSGSSHSHLTIFRHQFRKVLYEHADVDLKALSKFYKSIRSHRIPYFEYPLNERNMDSVALVFDTLELVMKPVGLARQPRTSDELKDCLLCILTALQDLHGRGYVHLDLRWPNVIIVAQREWYIIDGEYVRKSGDPYPQNLLIRAGDVAHYSADLTMLGMMLGALDDRDLLTSNVQELIDYLTKGRTRRSAGGALRLVRRW